MKHLIFLLFCFSVPGLKSCVSDPRVEEMPVISVSIIPQKYFINEITGGKINVNVMIPPSASHSSYEPGAQQLKSLEKSVAYFKIGYLDFEQAWLERFRGVNPNMRIFDLSQNIIPVINESGHTHSDDKTGNDTLHKGADPHTWMSPKNASIISANILNSLLQVYPSDSVLFRANYSILINKIDSIDHLFKNQSEKLQGKSFIIYHPALTYLARDYGMNQIALEFEGKEPPPAYIKQIIDRAKKENIRYIFVQRQLSMDNSKSLARETGAELVIFDPMNPEWDSEMIGILNILISK
jgi:zinc transport system substrate-binding protein